MIKDHRNPCQHELEAGDFKGPSQVLAQEDLGCAEGHMLLSAPLTFQFSASNPSSTSCRGEICPEQDMYDFWEALNNAKESPGTVPTSPSLPSAFLYLSQDPGCQKSSQNLCRQELG